MAEKKENIIKEVFDIGMNEMKDMAEVSDACGQFRQLLIEQLTRELMMEQDTEPPKDFKNLDTVTIGVCPGDGIGTIISIEAERVLRHLLADEIESGKIVILRSSRLYLMMSSPRSRPVMFSLRDLPLHLRAELWRAPM